MSITDRDKPADPTAWHQIHDFFRGWGVRHPEESKYIFADDVSRLLYKEMDFTLDAAGFDALYEQLIPKLIAEQEARQAHQSAYPRKEITHLTVPNITKSTCALRSWCDDHRSVFCAESQDVLARGASS